jgi:hypothetical protein
MFREFHCKAITALSLPFFVSACGVTTPFMEPGEDSPQNHVTGALVNKIVDHVKCELGEAILYEIHYDKANTATGPRNFPWLDTVVGTVTLTMTVDEKSALAPGATWTTPLETIAKTAQSFSLALGGSASADATRKQQVDFVFDAKKDFVDNAQFRQYHDWDTKVGTCGEAGEILIEGDLRIREWLDSALFPRNIPGNIDPAPGPPDVLTDDITFVVTFSGSVTPSWKLVRWSVNGATPFATAARARTNEALIALGPPGGKKGAPAPSDSVIQFRNISLIGSAISVTLRNQ